MITSMRILEIDAKRGEDNESKLSFDVLFNVEDVSVEKNQVKLKFAYAANYKSGGHIRIRGDLIADEDKETIKKIEAELKNKKLPAEYMQSIVNAVNYFGTTNATIISSVINLVPPIKLPVLEFRQEGKK